MTEQPKEVKLYVVAGGDRWEFIKRQPEPTANGEAFGRNEWLVRRRRDGALATATIGE